MSPAVKDNSLQLIIYLAKFYYKYKCFKQLTDFFLYPAICYLLFVCYNLTYQSENVTEQDLVLAGIMLEVLISKRAIDSEKIKKLSVVKKLRLWPDELLKVHERKFLRKQMRFYVFLEYLLWFLSIVVIVMYIITSYVHPKFVYNENWPFCVKMAYKLLMFAFCTCQYYMANSHLNYYTYAMLYNYLQMKILISYIRSGIGSQRDLLLRSIQRYGQIKKHGYEIAKACGTISLLHFFTVISVISVSIYSVLFKNPANYWMITMVVLHLILSAILCINCGQLFTEAYDELYLELIQVKWYKLNRNSRTLYYMFLVYTQKGSAIQILPRVQLTRPALTQLLKTIYSLIALLKSHSS